MEKSLEKMKQADVVLYLFDVNKMSSTELRKLQQEFERTKINLLLIGNKADGVDEAVLREKFAAAPGVIFIQRRQIFSKFCIGK